MRLRDAVIFETTSCVSADQMSSRERRRRGTGTLNVPSVSVSLVSMVRGT